MAHALHDFQFDQLVCDQSQTPALVSFRRWATKQHNQMRFLLAVRATGIRVAAASSSKNAKLLLSKVPIDTFAERNGLDYAFIRPGQTLLDVFDVDISGRTFKQGKPHPEIFLTAARELNVDPPGCFVVEDAVSGITAAKAGEMAALGIARVGDAPALAGAGADLVVTSLDDVDPGVLTDGRLVTVDRPETQPLAVS